MKDSKLLEAFTGREVTSSPPGSWDWTDTRKLLRQAAVAAAGAGAVVLIGRLQEADMAEVWWAALAVTALEGLRRWITGPPRTE